MLRERGDNGAAAALETGPLAELIASLRGATGSVAEFDQRLAAIFATEEERVANAAVLAELLLPVLSSGTPLFGQPAAGALAPVAADSTPLAPPPATPVRRAPGAIADFLDDMIAQEQAEAALGDRPRRAS